MKEQYLECGKIINTHGVRGAVKIDPWCDSPSDLAELERLYFKNGDVLVCRKLLHASVFKQYVLATLEGIDSIEKAALLKNQVVYADRADFHLEEGKHFLADLIGLSVIDAESGRVYGTLREIINRGASDIYVVDTPGGECMMPAVKEFVKRVDVDEGIFVTPIEGIFD